MNTVTRDTWQRALMGPCKGLSRDVRMTLLACSYYMTKDGRLSKPEATLAAAAAIETRALARHRKYAVEAGWLTRESAGHHGRTAVYRASLPVSQTGLRIVKHGLSDGLPDDEACHHPTGIKGVTGDRPVFKTLKGETATMGRPAPSAETWQPEGQTFVTENGRTLRLSPWPGLGRGESFQQRNPNPGKHARPSDNLRPSLADFDFGLRTLAPHQGSAS
jgi:hypothetical protein